MVQCPVGGSCEGFSAIAVAGVFRGDAAALFEPAPKVGVIEHHLADEPALQANGKVDGAAGGESAGSVSATMRPAQSATAAPAQTAAPEQAPTPTPAPTLEPLITATPTEAVEYAPTTLSGEDISFIDPTYVQRDGESVIYLAGGCFFGLESLMQQIDGVNSAVSGYANGDTVSPGYRDVASGLTGHRETVRVEYDPDVVSLDKLLYAYFAAIDPEQVNRQGHDV